METGVLEEMGLSKNESRVFVSLLRLGSASVSDITKHSGVHRANTYDVLDRLIARGLVNSVFRANKKYFEVSDPINLYEILKEKEARLGSLMPELSAIYDQRRSRQEVHHFKGKEGIKAVLRDINRYKTYDAFGISSNLAKVVPYYFPQWIRERLDKGLFARMIKTKLDPLVSPDIVGIRNYKRLFHVKEFPREYFTPAATWVYGGKVAIILEIIDNPLAVVIENEEITDGYKKHFNILWSMAEEEDMSIYEESKSRRLT